MNRSYYGEKLLISLCVLGALVSVASGEQWHNGVGKALHKDDVKKMCELSRLTKCVSNTLNTSARRILQQKLEAQKALVEMNASVHRFGELLAHPHGRLLDEELHRHVQREYDDFKKILAVLQQQFSALGITVAKIIAGEGVALTAQNKIVKMDTFILKTLFGARHNGTYCVGDGRSPVLQKDVLDCGILDIPSFRVRERCLPLKFPSGDLKPGSPQNVNCRLTSQYAYMPAKVVEEVFITLSFSGGPDVSVYWSDNSVSKFYRDLEEKYNTTQDAISEANDLFNRISSLKVSVDEVQKLVDVAFTNSPLNLLITFLCLWTIFCPWRILVE
ncbi:hypothetical protein ERJ75_000477100 [Trypanosoma vivax]|nr:hypothetical protein ERJ75_000477100 [Trypanosoma vivax]